MNKDLLRKVADAIEAQRVHDRAVGLNMNAWHGQGHACGTSACVAGFTELIVRHENNVEIPIDLNKTALVAQRALGLSYDEKDELFHAATLGEFLEPEKSQPYQIVEGMKRVNNNEHLVPDALRWMADNGVIDWRRGLDHACSVYSRPRHGEESDGDVQDAS